MKKKKKKATEKKASRVSTAAKNRKDAPARRKKGTTVVDVELARIERDRDIQPREMLDQQVIDDYAVAMEDGDEFPPAIVYSDGERYWLADGHLRAAASELAGQTTLRCEVRRGSRQDALLHAVGTDRTHGARRTRADQRRAVTLVLEDPEYARRSDNWIVEVVGVGPRFVAAVRSSLRAAASAREGRDDKKRKTRTKLADQGAATNPSNSSQLEPLQVGPAAPGQQTEQPSSGDVPLAPPHPVGGLPGHWVQLSQLVGQAGAHAHAVGQAWAQAATFAAQFGPSRMTAMFEGVRQMIADLSYALSFATPAAPCICEGANPQCQLCCGGGWVPEQIAATSSFAGSAQQSAYVAAEEHIG